MTFPAETGGMVERKWEEREYYFLGGYCIRNNFCQSSNMAVQNGFISRGSSGLPQLFRVAELFRAREARPEPAKT